MTAPELSPADLACLVVRGQLGSSKAMSEDLVRRVNADNLHPIVAKIFEWSEAKEAFEFSMSQSGVGK